MLNTFAQQLMRIGSVISCLNESCNSIKKHITLARQESGPMLEEAATLLAQKQGVETKQRLLDSFNQHFLISEDDLAALTNSTEPVDDRFFHVLDRVKQVHRQCEVLLGGESHRLGTDLMEQTSKNLNAAFKKLYNWTQKEFKSLNLEDPAISGAIRKALRVLGEKPLLFQNCLTFFAEAREHSLSESFHSALTVSGVENERGGGTKPIDFSTHDPLRYEGDMLAWIHSAAVSEHEALEGLFISNADDMAKDIRAGLSREPWTGNENGQTATFDGQKALNELVGRTLSGVSRALKQRTEIIVYGTDDVVIVYKITNLLAFYHGTFAKLVGVDSHLSSTVQFLSTAAFDHFETLVQDGITQFPVSSLRDDLSPPAFLITALEQLSRLMRAYDTSLRAPAVGDPADNPFTRVLHTALDPVLDRCSELSAKNLTEPTTKIMFELNYLLLVRSTLTSFSFASESRVPSLETRISILTEELIEIQHTFLLHASGLNKLLTALLPPSDSVESTATPDLHSLLSITQLQPGSLRGIAQQLDDFLPSALIDAKENLSRLKDAGIVQQVTQAAAGCFCEDFEFVEDKLLAVDEVIAESNGTASEEQASGEDHEDGRVALRELFPRTGAEIRVLLT